MQLDTNRSLTMASIFICLHLAVDHDKWKQLVISLTCSCAAKLKQFFFAMCSIPQEILVIAGHRQRKPVK